MELSNNKAVAIPPLFILVFRVQVLPAMPVAAGSVFVS